MPTDSDQVRDQQRDTWDKFSADWKKWDDDVVQWLAPFGEAMIGHAGLKPDSHVLDVARQVISSERASPENPREVRERRRKNGRK